MYMYTPVVSLVISGTRRTPAQSGKSFYNNGSLGSMITPATGASHTSDVANMCRLHAVSPKLVSMAKYMIISALKFCQTIHFFTGKRHAY